MFGCGFTGALGCGSGEFRESAPTRTSQTASDIDYCLVTIAGELVAMLASGHTSSPAFFPKLHLPDRFFDSLNYRGTRHLCSVLQFLSILVLPSPCSVKTNTLAIRQLSGWNLATYRLPRFLEARLNHLFKRTNLLTDGRTENRRAPLRLVRHGLCPWAPSGGCMAMHDLDTPSREQCRGVKQSKLRMPLVKSKAASAAVLWNREGGCVSLGAAVLQHANRPYFVLATIGVLHVLQEVLAVSSKGCGHP